MIMDVKATVIADMIATNLDALVTAVSTTSLHEKVITTSTAVDPAAVQWTHMGHSVLISAVTLHTAALAVPATVATGTTTEIDAIGMAEIEITAAGLNPLKSPQPDVCVSVGRISIVDGQNDTVRNRTLAGIGRLRHLLANVHRQR